MMEFPPALAAPIDGVLEFIYSFGPSVEHTVVLGEFTVSNTERFDVPLTLASYN